MPRLFSPTAAHAARTAHTARTAHGQPGHLTLARKVLQRMAATWLVVALLGQGLFMLYVARFYGGAVLAGDVQAWQRVMPRAWLPGDALGNGVLASHLLFTVVVLLGGALQL